MLWPTPGRAQGSNSQNVSAGAQQCVAKSFRAKEAKLDDDPGHEKVDSNEAEGCEGVYTDVLAEICISSIPRAMAA
jgi:hypothetical protein